MDGGAWWATVHRVAKSQTQLSARAHARKESDTTERARTHAHSIKFLYTHTV